MLCLQQLGLWDAGILGCCLQQLGFGMLLGFWDTGVLGYRDFGMLCLQQLGFWNAGILGYRVYSGFGAVFGSPELSEVAAQIPEQLFGSGA